MSVNSTTTKTTTSTPSSAGETKRRYPHHTQMVAHEDVPRFLERGWEWTSALVDTHHGERAALMVWPHETEPPSE